VSDQMANGGPPEGVDPAQMDPEMMGPDAGGMPVAPPMTQVDPQDVTNELLRAVKISASKANAAQDMRETAEGARAALAFAQALVILDPTLGQDGVPLDHQLALEDARASAAAPSPARSVRVKRDEQGRASSFETEG
jgi:hypothetical protein